MSEEKICTGDIDDILTSLNSQMHIFYDAGLEDYNYIVVDFGKHLRDELSDMQAKLVESIKLKQDNADELAHYYNNLEADYEKKCKKNEQLFLDSIMIFNSIKEEQAKQSYTLAFNADTKTFYLKQLGEEISIYYVLYVNIMVEYTNFMRCNWANI